MKEAANRIGFGETVANEGTGFGCSKERLLEFKTACSRTIQTPALKCAGRITVDAREKD
jgi:hypothetical protein